MLLALEDGKSESDSDAARKSKIDSGTTVFLLGTLWRLPMHPDVRRHTIPNVCVRPLEVKQKRYLIHSIIVSHWHREQLRRDEYETRTLSFPCAISAHNTVILLFGDDSHSCQVSSK